MDTKDKDSLNFSTLFDSSRHGDGILRIPAPKSLLFLLCVFVICFIVTAFLSAIVMRLVGNAVAALRIATMVQDVVLFALPAIATAFISSRRPAQMLGLMKAPHVKGVVLTLLILLVSIPILESIIYWNYHWDWLPPMIERLARMLEDNANGTINMMLGNTSAANLILNILIIGVAAGLCEELLFRGAFLGILLRSGISKHVAVWLVAFIFSAMHMQIFGFVPRLLLGVLFGYLFAWSGSLWLSVLAHVANNTFFVVVAWFQVRSTGIGALTQEPTLWSWNTCALSMAGTFIALYMLRSYLLGRRLPAGQ